MTSRAHQSDTQQLRQFANLAAAARDAVGEGVGKAVCIEVRRTVASGRMSADSSCEGSALRTDNVGALISIGEPCIAHKDCHRLSGLERRQCRELPAPDNAVENTSNASLLAFFAI